MVEAVVTMSSSLKELGNWRSEGTAECFGMV